VWASILCDRLDEVVRLDQAAKDVMQAGRAALPPEV
jgi:hypothetical protein